MRLSTTRQQPQQALESNKMAAQQHRRDRMKIDLQGLSGGLIGCVQLCLAAFSRLKNEEKNSHHPLTTHHLRLMWRYGYPSTMRCSSLLCNVWVKSRFWFQIGGRQMRRTSCIDSSIEPLNSACSPCPANVQPAAARF